jgi:hypothetical protein
MGPAGCGARPSPDRIAASSPIVLEGGAAIGCTGMAVLICMGGDGGTGGAAGGGIAEGGAGSGMLAPYVDATDPYGACSASTAS